MRMIMVAAYAFALAACSSTSSMQGIATASSSGGVFSSLWPFSGSSEDEASTDNTPQLGVNSFLWRATLDTLNFMPLASEDPVGGVVISDWYAAPDKPDEHMKVTVYILDKRLRADAIKVAVFRQVRMGGVWMDAQVNPDTGVRLENAILTRARELRLSATPQ